jgi:dihydropteroate synthase
MAAVYIYNSQMTFAPRPHFDWRLRTRTLALGERTLIMAIVNLTPDSFSGDGVARQDTGHTTAAGIAAAVSAVDSGADIIDLGAESTRPSSEPLSSEEEQLRLLPVLEGLLRERSQAIVSVDTYHAATARNAALMGAEIINDVSGLLWDKAMATTVASAHCGLLLMHTRGRPQDWRALPPLTPEEVVPLVQEGLREQLMVAQSAGISREQIVIDPGFGFGKLGRDNFALLAGLHQLSKLGYPLLAGVSRKAFLGEAVRAVQPAGLPLAEARRTATIAANVAAVLNGAHILRVHDVQQAREAAAVADAVMKQSVEDRA